MKSAVPLNADGVPVSITTVPVYLDQDKVIPKFEVKSDLVKQLQVLGSVQIVLGALSMVAQAVSVGICARTDLWSLFFVGYGFWIGGLFIATGVIGIVASMRKSICTAFAFFILSITSASFTVPLLCLAIASAVMGGTYSNWTYVYDDKDTNTTTSSYYYYYNYRSGHYEKLPSEYLNAQKVVIAMETLMAIVAIVEAIVAIRSSIAVRQIRKFCCKCNGCDYHQPNQSSNQPSIMICQGRTCFCYCVDYCCLPPNQVIRQPIIFGTGDRSNAENVLEINIGSELQHQSIMMNKAEQKHSSISDQQLMIDDQSSIGEIGQKDSDHAKLVGDEGR